MSTTATSSLALVTNAAADAFSTLVTAAAAASNFAKVTEAATATSVGPRHCNNALLESHEYRLRQYLNAIGRRELT